MSCEFKPEHPDQFFSAGWDAEADQPVVDGKYYDRKTGELRKASGSHYSGPPDVDIVVLSLHEDTAGYVYRASRPFPVEKLLYIIMGVVHRRKLDLDSLSATKYAIRIVLAHTLTKEEIREVSREMANGIWSET